MSESRDRPSDTRPWCWQEKSVIRIIQNAYDSKTYLDQALAVYLVLTVISSDKQSSTFERSKRDISAKSGVSLRRVTTILGEFRSLGVLDWKTNRQPDSKELLPNTYTLMSGTGCPRLGTERFRDNCAVLEESLEKSSKKNVKEETRSSSKSRCTQKEAEEFCKEIGLPSSDGMAMFLHWEEKGWAKVKDWKLTIRKWQSFGYLPSQKQSNNGPRQFQSKPKERAPSYPKLTEKREPTEEEFELHRKIARECTEKLKQQFRMNNHP